MPIRAVMTGKTAIPLKEVMTAMKAVMAVVIVKTMKAVMTVKTIKAVMPPVIGSQMTHKGQNVKCIAKAEHYYMYLDYVDQTSTGLTPNTSLGQHGS